MDRLIGAAIDIPVAWLTQKAAKIEAQTQAFTVVEKAIGEAAARVAGGDESTVERAMASLVRKQYRQQKNREAVAFASLEDLRAHTRPEDESAKPTPEQAEVDEDWLNVFERYAEDASTERMQNLWGRVLAGEIRRPGKYAVRTLRFLSEFSQSDGLMFAELGKSTFGDLAPNSLVKPRSKADIRDLIYLESSGLIQGATGGTLTYTLTIRENGIGVLREGALILIFEGEPGSNVSCQACILTPLGQELLSLLPGRDAKQAARAVANTLRRPGLTSATLAVAIEGQDKAIPMEILWQESEPGSEIGSPLPEQPADGINPV